MRNKQCSGNSSHRIKSRVLANEIDVFVHMRLAYSVGGICTGVSSLVKIVNDWREFKMRSTKGETERISKVVGNDR